MYEKDREALARLLQAAKGEQAVTNKCTPPGAAVVACAISMSDDATVAVAASCAAAAAAASSAANCASLRSLASIWHKQNFFVNDMASSLLQIKG